MKKTVFSEAFSNEKLDTTLNLVNEKQSVMDKFYSKQEPYYTTRVVKKKSRTYILGFVGEPDISYETEIIYNGDHLIISHLEAINKSMENCFYIVNRAGPTLDFTLSKTEKAKSDREKVIEDLKKQIANTKNEIEKVQIDNNDLLVKVKPLEVESTKLNDNIQSVQQQINALPNINMITNHNSKFEIDDYVDNLNESQRTILLIELWDKVDEFSKTVINIIKAKGFNVNYQDIDGKSLMHWAINKSDIELINLIISQDSSCLEEKGLLQYLLKNNCDQVIIERVLSSKADLKPAFKYMISNNDYHSIKKILQIEPSLIDNLKPYESLEQNKLEIALLILNKNTNYDFLIIEAIEKNNHTVMTNLFKVFKEAYSSSKIDQTVLLKYAAECGDEEFTAFILDQINIKNVNEESNQNLEFFINSDEVNNSNLFDQNVLGQELDLSLMNI